MNTVGTAVSSTTKGFWSVLMTIYQNPIVSKIIAIVVAVIVTFVLLAISRIIATFIKNKITKSFVARGSKEVQNVSALIGDVIFYALAMLSFFVSFSIVGMNIGLIL
jgi:small-conductance mechanosensitive channel